MPTTTKVVTLIEDTLFIIHTPMKVYKAIPYIQMNRGLDGYEW